MIRPVFVSLIEGGHFVPNMRDRLDDPQDGADQAQQS